MPSLEATANAMSGDESLDDIESEIRKELESMKSSTTKKPITLVKLDIPCGKLN